MRLTVTLARQLGCGGSYLGQSLADALQIRCLDREIVSRTAQQLALNEEELAQREERVSSFWERMLRGMSAGPPEALYHAPIALSPSDQEVFEAESEVMKQIAAQEDCVVVGRVASHVLPAHAGTVNIFLHAPLRFRIQRLVTNHQAADEAQARDLISRSDETRKRFISQMIGRDWEAASNYHLCLDTSSLPLPEICDLLVGYVQRKTAGR